MDHAWYHALPFGRIPRPLRDAGFSALEVEILDIVISGMELKKSPLKEGRKWIYNKSERWEKLLGVSRNTFKRTVQRLVDRQVLITRRDLNARAYDETTWFTVPMGELRKQINVDTNSLKDFYSREPKPDPQKGERVHKSTTKSRYPKRGAGTHTRYPKRGAG